MEKIEKQKQFIFPEKISTFYSYYYDIDTVFKALRDFEALTPYFTQMRSEVTYIKGDNCYTIDNIFTLIWYNQTILRFKVVEVIDEIYFKKINWRVFAEQWNISYNYCIEFYYITSDEATLMNFSLCYDNPENLPFTKTTLADYHRIVLESCTYWEKYLIDNGNKYEQIESLTINCDRKRIWQILINLNKLYQFDKNNSTFFEYEGEYLKENLLIKMKDLKLNFSETFIVKNIKSIHLDEKWSYDLDNYENDNFIDLMNSINNENNNNTKEDNKKCQNLKKYKIPKQKINFSLIEVSENKNFLIIKHTFKNKISRSDLKSLSNNKIKILTGLKKYLEKNFLH